MRVDTAARLLEAAGVSWVRFELADIHGIARSKSVPLAQFPHYAERGVAFYGGTLLQDPRGDDIPPLSPGQPDCFLRPDLDTLAVLPHAHGEARVGGDLWTADGRPAGADPRRVLRRVVEQYARIGLVPRTGVEYEFYLLDACSGVPVFPDSQVCATLRNNVRPGWRDEVLGALSRLGVAVSAFAAENAPGQFEITFAPGNGVEAADQAFIFRTTVKEISARHGLIAPFMSKPFADAAGSGCHLHHSLLDVHTGTNRFAGEPREDLAPLGRHFIGGLLAHARALCALLAPTPNDYKRYRPDSFAPVAATWGVDDRGAAVRVLTPASGATRVENRLAGAAANPYIAVAASLAAGLLGIRDASDLPAETTDGDCPPAPALPTSLEEALDAFEGDAELRALLGEDFTRTYTLVKRNDVARARAACPDYGSDDWSVRVDNWERREYGELI